MGSHCVLELLKEDFNVICIDNFVNCQKGEKIPFLYKIFLSKILLSGTDKYPESISRVQALTGKDVKFYEADITCKDSLRQVINSGH